MYYVIDGNFFMVVVDKVVEKGVNMIIDIIDEVVFWKMFFVNFLEFYWDDIKNSWYFFMLLE